MKMNETKIKFTIKDLGTITAELYPEKAPATVENFLSLVESGFFSGLIFHRVINGFMIQGGGFDEAFEQKEAKSIKGEFMANGFIQNDLRHTRGVLSMARTMAPNSASSQFFIMHMETPSLNGSYAAFGYAADGRDVVDAIAKCKTNGQDMPIDDIVITSIRFAKAK